jgi:tryptophan synthase beta subunit
VTEVDLRIDGLGYVATAVVKSDTTADTALDRCLENAFKKWRFSDTQKGYTLSCTVGYHPVAAMPKRIDAALGEGL